MNEIARLRPISDLPAYANYGERNDQISQPNNLFTATYLLLG